MATDELPLLEIFAGIHEELDVGRIEERFVELVDAAYHFDRIALLFVKHGKGTVRAKLGRGFPVGALDGVELPIRAADPLTGPLVTGLPARIGGGATPLGLGNALVVPVVTRRRLACWELKGCGQGACPAFGRKWLRCWMVPGTLCVGSRALNPEEKSSHCRDCFVRAEEDSSSVEGILVVDNTPSGRPISEDIVPALCLISYAVGMAIHNAKRFQKVLEESIRDQLTGLHNRAYGRERLVSEVERCRRSGDQVSVVLCDIDHFKQVNDTLGHAAGDEVLRNFGRRLLAGVRRVDLVSRYGGEEFLVLLPGAGQEASLVVAEKLRGAIEAEPVSFNGAAVPVTASFGVASLASGVTTADELLEQADRELYRAKALGRNRVSG